MLAKEGWQVTVVEKSVDLASYDPGRGFMYLIDGRGQRCLSELSPDLMERLKSSSVSMMETRIGILTPGGLKETVNPMKDATRNSYWLPRHVFVSLLEESVRLSDRIRVISGASIESLQNGAGGGFTARGSTAQGEPWGASGSLLVGADGIRSTVRSHMEEWDGGRGRFVPQEFDSPSAGLRYKVLTLPASSTLDTPAGSEELVSEVMYSVRGAVPRGKKLKLGLIPVRSEFGSRTANAITKPEDKFWEVRDAAGLRAYAAEQWPHFPLEKLVPEAELERFAADRGGHFPRPQHPAAAVWKAPPCQVAAEEGDAAEAAGGAAAVLVGDALHCFPPDIGQGVNSALEDVMVLRDALRGSASAGERGGAARPLARAALAYEAERMPDTEALVQMVRFAAPFQYSQDPWRARLWSICFLTRFLLNKALPRVFDLPAFMLVQQSELRYREALARGRRGARRASAALLLMAAAAAAAGVVVRLAA